MKDHEGVAVTDHTAFAGMPAAEAHTSVALAAVGCAPPNPTPVLAVAAVAATAIALTGGYAAEYGNRFGGILDVVTKSGFTMKNRGSVTLGTGEGLQAVYAEVRSGRYRRSFTLSRELDSSNNQSTYMVIFGSA